MIIAITNNGYIKKTPKKEFPIQEGLKTKTFKPSYADGVKVLKEASNGDTLLLFSDAGKCFTIDVVDIPYTNVKESGISLNEILGLNNESICSILPTYNLFSSDDIDDYYVLIMTKKGKLIKHRLTDYKYKKMGFQCVSLNDEDLVSSSILLKSENKQYQHILCCSSQGRGHLFLDDVRITSMGTKGISCWDNNPQTTLYNPLLNLISVDSIVASENVHLYNPREAIDSNTLYPSCLMISELGNQNRIYLQRITHRIGNGCLLMETKENDSIVYGVLANDINNLLVVTAKGYTKCINIGKIKPCKSGKKGSKFIYMSDDDKIVACCCISPLKTIQINQEKINSFIVQTNESQELLSHIFNEDKSEESTTIIETNDSIVKEILSLLLTKEIWTKEELQQICAKRGIMLGSILEEINDYSYATLDDAVVEDKGTFINVEISYKDLLL